MEAVLNIRDTAHDREEVAAAHTFLEKICFYALDNAMKITIKSLSETPAGLQRKVILESGVIVGVAPELVLEEGLLTQPPVMRPPSRLQHPALQRGFAHVPSFESAVLKQSSQQPRIREVGLPQRHCWRIHRMLVSQLKLLEINYDITWTKSTEVTSYQPSM
jgi:hypothetical protein